MAEGAEGMTRPRSKRKRFSERPPDGPFGASAAWIHGGCGTPEYSAYTAAKSLCRNPKNPRWHQFGGRGIEFRFTSFASFLEHLGRCPAGKVLRRNNSEGHFDAGNVRWITRRKSIQAPRTPPTPTSSNHLRTSQIPREGALPILLRENANGSST